MNDDPESALIAAGKRVRDATDLRDDAVRDAMTLVRRVASEISERRMASLLGVDRMTVRDWLGKRRRGQRDRPNVT